jgi:hypothetical protein
MTTPEYHIVRCPSCDGYGWLNDELSGEVEDCDWCRGTGYVFRDAAGIDRPIPEEEYGRVSALLETMDHERLRDMGYTGSAKHPDDQEIRKASDTESE